MIATNKNWNRLIEVMRKAGLLFLIVLLIDVGSVIPYYHLYAKRHGTEKILETANKIVEGINDDEQKVRALMMWVNSNMESSYLAIFIPKYPFINIYRPDDPNWTIFTMYGGCEEYADLFVALANSLNISARTVHNSGEDHVWAEVYIDGRWVHADPSIAPNGLYNDPGIYERKRENGGWGKNISAVWYRDSKGRIHSVTERYTNVSKIKIKVLFDNRPVENATVIIKSWYLKENHPKYRKRPLFTSITNKTDTNGIAEVELGGGKYTIVAEKDIFKNIIGYRSEKIIRIGENNEYFYEINPKKITILEGPRTILSYLLGIFVLSFYLLLPALVVLAIIYILKKEKFLTG
jgi:hypothetical protein